MEPALDATSGLSPLDLTAILEHIQSGVVVVDQSGRPTFMNQAARKLLDRARLLPGAPIFEVSAAVGMRHAATQQAVTREAGPVVRALAGEAVPGDYYIVSEPTGGETRLFVSAFPRRDASGAIVGAVSVFTEFTPEREHAERMAQLFEAEQRARSEAERAKACLEQELVERKRAEEALQASEQRLRLALEASHMGMWDYDVQHDRLEWSREMASILGAPQEPLARPLRGVFEHVHAEDAPEVQRAFEDALTNGRSLKLEMRVTPPAGSSVRWLMVRGRVYRDQAGRPLRMTGIAMDVTERKEAEAARQTLAQSERLRALGQMASGIAHDLNQSLALITGYSDMARQELTLDVPNLSRVREMVEITARAAVEGGQALKGLLSFVRTQELMAEGERFDLGDVLRDAARLTAPRWRDASQAEGRPIRLDVQAEAGLFLHGSPGAIREAITNLVFNAVDAMPHGGEIHLTARRTKDGKAVVDITDTGTGIPPEVQKRIFDPFFTTKGERGTGLGLPQVAAIVERHAGTTELQSVVGRGTTFRLTFPLAEDAPGQPAECRADAPQPATAGAARSIRILVVEDEQQLARMAAMVLTQRGHHVTVAESFEAAAAHLEHEPVELIISDLGLGTGKNGWDLAQLVRERWPLVRFVLVTGWGAAIDPKEAQARGVDEVIAKPYRIADLRQLADRVAGTA